MANDLFRSLGLRPLDQPYGNRRVNYYKAETSQAIYMFQPVALNNSGTVSVAGVAAGATILGTAVGFLDSNKASLPSGITSLSAASYLPASTDGYVAVTDDPQQMYMIEEGSGGTNLTSSAIGNGCVLTYLATTGNTTTGIANLVISQSSITTTTSANYRIVRLRDNVNQDGTMNAAGSGGVWVLLPLFHQNAPVFGTLV